MASVLAASKSSDSPRHSQASQYSSPPPTFVPPPTVGAMSSPSPKKTSAKGTESDTKRSSNASMHGPKLSTAAAPASPAHSTSSPSPITINTDINRQSHSSLKSRGSLGSIPTSSRPAPPSPARSSASQTPSRRSSQNTTNRRSKGSRLSQLSMSQFNAPSTKRQSKLASQPENMWKAEIRIIDFAFEDPSDSKRCGLGEHVPKPNRPAILNSRLGAAPPHADDDAEEDEEDEEEDKSGLSGWWSGGLSRLSWTFGNKEGSNRGDDPSGESPFPTKNDLERNFVDDVDDDDDEQYESAEEGDEDNDTPPGLYKALYEFEPEGTSEMRLAEDQIVRVVGKGGGVGWVVVENETGGHALVPESYLEWFGELDERR